MLIDNALARPFSRWDVPLGEGEPAHGYFARLVANEGHQSVRVYANEIGLNGRNIVPEEMLEAIKQLPLPQGSVEELEMWTPIREGNFYKLGREVLRPKQMSWTSRRWCPSCLAESRHYRIWWDIVCYEVCPRHQMRLVSKLEGDRVIGWHWPHFDIGPDGDVLTSCGAATSTDPALERFIEDRLLGREADRLRDHALHDIIDVSALLGGFLVDEGAAIRAGFEALTLDDGDLRERLRARIVETVPAGKRRRGLAASMHGLLQTPTLRSGHPLSSWFERQLLQAFADVGRIARKRFRNVDIERGDFTLVETASMLGLNPKALSRFAKSLEIGHTHWKDAHSYSAEDIDALREKLGELITLPETIEITGMPAHEFRFLERAGLIKGYYLGFFKGLKGVRYLRSEVLELVERAWAGAGNSEGDAVTLFTYFKQTGRPQGEIMTMVVKGELVPCRLDPKATGFRRLMFNIPV